MKTSPIWTATYSALGSRGCWSQTWGKSGGPEISAKTAVALAEKFLKDHRMPLGEVPSLLRIDYLFPFAHEELSLAYNHDETDYHERTL